MAWDFGAITRYLTFRLLDQAKPHWQKEKKRSLGLKPI